MSEYKKEYLKGSGKIFEFPNGGHSIDISIAEEDFQKIPTYKSKAGVVYRTFSVASKREKGQYGDTHSIMVSKKEGGGSSSTAKANDGFFE